MYLNKKTIQRQQTESETVGELRIHVPRGSRTGSTRQTLDRFTNIIPDMEEFNNIANSYGLQPNQLLAIFMTEGGFASSQYLPPSEYCPSGTRINSEAGLVGFHLWAEHGMDDFAIIGARDGGDNTFNCNAGNIRYQNNIRNTLAEFFNWGCYGIIMV